VPPSIFAGHPDAFPYLPILFRGRTLIVSYDHSIIVLNDSGISTKDRIFPTQRAKVLYLLGTFRTDV
jgi:hypothetical protein